MSNLILENDITPESAIYQKILKEGEFKAKLKIAINLITREMSVEEVINITDLSRELVQYLRAEFEKIKNISQ